MGYTHHWEHDGFTDQQWIAMLRMAEKIKPVAASAGVDTAVEMDNDYINVNGIDEDAHEDCYLTKEAQGYTFCKTNRNNYDGVVVALLCWAHQQNPRFKWWSDGSNEPDYQDAGLALIAKATNALDFDEVGQLIQLVRARRDVPGTRPEFCDTLTGIETKLLDLHFTLPTEART